MPELTDAPKTRKMRRDELLNHSMTEDFQAIRDALDEREYADEGFRKADAALDRIYEQYEGERARALFLQKVVDEAEATERQLKEQVEASERLRSTLDEFIEEHRLGAEGARQMNMHREEQRHLWALDALGTPRFRNPSGGVVSKRDPVRALEAVAEAAREYAKFVIFKPNRPAAAARERLEAALADYDEIVSTPAKSQDPHKEHWNVIYPTD